MEHVSRWGDGGGGGWGKHSFIWLIRVRYACAAEHKDLSINQGVELYCFNSKNVIIYFIIFLVKFYFNSKFA